MNTGTDAATNPRVAQGMGRVTAALAGPGNLKEKLATLDSVTLLMGALGSAEPPAILLVDDHERFGVAKGTSAMIEVVLDRLRPEWDA